MWHSLKTGKQCLENESFVSKNAEVIIELGFKFKNYIFQGPSNETSLGRPVRQFRVVRSELMAGLQVDVDFFRFLNLNFGAKV